MRMVRKRPPVAKKPLPPVPTELALVTIERSFADDRTLIVFANRPMSDEEVALIRSSLLADGCKAVADINAKTAADSSGEPA